MGSAFDLGFQQVGENQRQKALIAEQQRTQAQNNIGAQLLDAINQSSSIKPTMKDDQGNVVENPAYAQAQEDRRKLLTQYTSLYSPEQHASFSDRLHGLIFGHPTPHHQQPALSPNSSPNAPMPDPNAPAAAAPPAAPAPLHPMASAPPDHPLHAITSGIKGLGEHLKAFAHPLPEPAKVDPDLVAKYYRDPADVQFEHQKELANERGQFQIEAAKARGQNVRPVPNNQASVALNDAMKLRESGQEFNDRNGDPIDLDSLKDAGVPLKLVPVLSPAGNYYMVANQKDRLQVVGNQVVTLPETGTTTPAEMASLGTKNLGSESTHQVPGMNPGEVVTLTGTRTPATGAVPTAGTPMVPETDPTLQTRPVAAPAPVKPVSLPPSPSAQAVVDKTNQGRSKSKQIPQPNGQPMPPAFAKGTMLSQGRSAQPVVAAMSVVAANVFGGNGDKPIWDNAWMYDKPELRQALNNALTLNALANPGTEDDPTVMQQLMTATGATQWGQEQINQANVAARQELQRLGGDAALEQFAREAALQEDLSALRTATKASAAQGSIRTLVRAAPVYNISSAQDFRNQLGATLNTASAGMKGYPAINPEYIKWWDRGVHAAKGGPTSTNAPKIHEFAIDDQGRRRPVLDPNAKLPTGWKWATK